MLSLNRIATRLSSRAAAIPSSLQLAAFQAARLAAPASRTYSSSSNNGNGKSEASNNQKSAEESTTAAANNGEAGFKKTLAEKDKQITELKDSYLRALADAENVRTQMRRQVEETSQFAIRKFAKDLLDTVDILGMALKSVPAEKRVVGEADTMLTDLYTGVSMTETELLRALKRHGVEPFEALDQPFDPNLHQADFQAPIPGKQPGTVFQVEKRGFKIKERILRPAQVGVVSETS